MTMARTVRIGLFALLIAMGSLGGDAIAQRRRGGAANAQQNRSAGPPAGVTPLLADAKKAGGPTIHTRQALPNWDGRYRRLAPQEQWVWGRNLQTPTLLSLLTPEYQRRMVQQNYHEVVNNSPQWMAAFCYPEGMM